MERILRCLLIHNIFLLSKVDRLRFVPLPYNATTVVIGSMPAKERIAIIIFCRLSNLREGRVVRGLITKRGTRVVYRIQSRKGFHFNFNNLALVQFVPHGGKKAYYIPNHIVLEYFLLEKGF
jgi:hypothetical protein